MAPDLRDLIQQLQDGCSNIFLDLGANIGMHSRFLFEADRYPSERHPSTGAELHQYAAVFDRQFGRDRNRSATCAVAFEPNPQHAARHRRLSAAYAKLGWRHIHVAAGISDRSGPIAFYANGGYAKTGAKNFLSFATTRLDKSSAPPTLVPAVDFAHLLSLLRALRPTPRVLVKMDIEGLEFAVLPTVLPRWPALSMHRTS